MNKKEKRVRAIFIVLLLLSFIFSFFLLKDLKDNHFSGCPHPRTESSLLSKSFKGRVVQNKRQKMTPVIIECEEEKIEVFFSDRFCSIKSGNSQDDMVKISFDDSEFFGKNFLNVGDSIITNKNQDSFIIYKKWNQTYTLYELHCKYGVSNPSKSTSRPFFLISRSLSISR